MRNWLRRWLGIADLERKVDVLHTSITTVHAEVTSILFDEFDPRRKAASDALGERHRQRLIAEDKARRHTLGEL